MTDQHGLCCTEAADTCLVIHSFGEYITGMNKTMQPIQNAETVLLE